MSKTSTLFILTCVFSLLSIAGFAQSEKTPPSEGGTKIIKLFPNPATAYINFDIQVNQHNNERFFDLIVYNFLGKKIDQASNISGRYTLPLSNYYSGVYIFQLRDKKGNLIESGKFNVIR